jgi:hypothetical protein
VSIFEIGLPMNIMAANWEETVTFGTSPIFRQLFGQASASFDY